MRDSTQVLREAIQICDECQSAGAEVRLFGGLAASITGKSWFSSHAAFARAPGDIDIAGRKADLAIVRQVVGRHAFEEVKEVALNTEGGRALFGREDITVDFAGDALDFCQRLPIRSRLKLSYPTLPFGDLILEKLQIAEPASPQLVDFIALISSRGMQPGDQEYIDGILGRHWGFWYSAKRFLGLAAEFASSNGLSDALQRIQALDARLGTVHKTPAWHVRSVFGTALPWHAPVEPLRGAPAPGRRDRR